MENLWNALVHGMYGYLGIFALIFRILNDNHIEKLDRRSFETLVHLHELKMNGNRIAHLPTGIFTKLKKVKKL